MSFVKNLYYKDIMNEFIHLAYNPGPSGWILRLQTRLHNSISATLIERYSKWKDLGLSEIGMAFATRLSLRYRAAYNFSKLMQELRDEINSSGQLVELLNEGSAYNPKDHRIFYDICVAFDSLYFESRSAYEIIGNFIRVFGKKILDCNFTENEILQVLSGAGQQTDWIGHIRENRKLFFHETAPWIALHILKQQPLECSLIVMKENLQNFDDPSKFITQQQLLDAWDGFERSIPTICSWLIAQIDNFERKERET